MPRDGLDPVLVSGVRFASHDTFDRVVIDLGGDIPGYTARWVPHLVQDGSGKRIKVSGGGYLLLVLRPAEAHTAKGDLTWKGGPVFRADLGNVTDVVRTGDFEGRVGVGVVVDHVAAFRVQEQADPNRLILDVAH